MTTDCRWLRRDEAALRAPCSILTQSCPNPELDPVSERSPDLVLTRHSGLRQVDSRLEVPEIECFVGGGLGAPHGVVPCQVSRGSSRRWWSDASRTPSNT